jgi:hypothetical protein
LAIGKYVEILDYWAQAKRDAAAVNKFPMLMMRYNGLPKEFYYVVVGNTLMKLIWHTEPLKFSDATIIHYTSKTNNIWVIPSNWFFQLPYREIRKLAKKHLRNGQSKRK